MHEGSDCVLYLRYYHRI